MPEFNGQLQPPIGPQERTERLIAETNQVLQQAVEIVYPGQDLSPIEAFAPPTERRDDAEALDLTEEQEAGLRTAAAELGFGRRTDRTAEQAGLKPGFAAVIEGGQPHKVQAEVELTDTAGVLIFAASPNRKITNPAERQSAAHILGCGDEQVADTEYDVVRQLAEYQPGFVAIGDLMPMGREIVEHFSYEVGPGFAVGQEPTGQLAFIGFQDDRPVYMLRIDREDYLDDNGQPKYRHQPDSKAVLGLTQALLEQMYGHGRPDQIGLVTSSTYQASRSVDAARAGLQTDTDMAVISYGADRLATVKGQPTAAGPINQLPGELHKTAVQLAALKTELAQR